MSDLPLPPLPAIGSKQGRDEWAQAYAREAVRAAVERERLKVVDMLRILGEQEQAKAEKGSEPVAWLTPGGDVTRSETYALQQSASDRINYPMPLYAHPPVQPTEPRPWVSLSESEIMRLWRDAGLPEYFLGNGGSNAHLCQFAALVIAESRCRNGFANPPAQPTEPK